MWGINKHPSSQMMIIRLTCPLGNKHITRNFNKHILETHQSDPGKLPPPKKKMTRGAFWVGTRWYDSWERENIVSRCRSWCVRSWFWTWKNGQSQKTWGCCKRKHEVGEIRYKKDGWNMLEHQWQQWGNPTYLYESSDSCHQVFRKHRFSRSLNLSASHKNPAICCGDVLSHWKPMRRKKTERVSREDWLLL